MKKNTALLIGLAVAIVIAVWVYCPVPQNVELEMMKIELDESKVKLEELEVDNDALIEENDTLRDHIYDNDIRWENEKEKIKYRNRRQVPNTRDEVLSHPLPEQLEWWNSKRSNADPSED